MPATRRGLWLLIPVLALAALVLYVRLDQVEPPLPGPADGFAFAVMGDAPYYPHEEIQFRRVLRQLQAADLAWVLSVGDILWRPCSDAMYERRHEQFQQLRHPVIYTPGDNEWTDCHEPRVGAWDPLERLGRLREVFFARPGMSLGATPLRVETQARQPQFAGFPENVRWQHEGVVVATAHIVGSYNAAEAFPGRTAASETERVERTAAAAAWVRETFAVARAAGAWAVFLAFHKELYLGLAPEDEGRQVAEPFLLALEEESAGFDGQVLLMHGDDHEFTVDRPLIRRTTGQRLENVTRLQVPGSPDVGWVRVVVTPGGTPALRYEARIVPRWKLW